VPAIQLRQAALPDEVPGHTGHLYLALVDDSGQELETLQGGPASRKPGGTFDTSVDAPFGNWHDVAPVAALHWVNRSLRLKPVVKLDSNGEPLLDQNKQPIAASKTLASGDPAEVNAIWQRGIDAAVKLSNDDTYKGIQYVPQGVTNSNAIAYTLSRAMGLEPPSDIPDGFGSLLSNVFGGRGVSKDGFIVAPGYQTDLRSFVPERPQRFNAVDDVRRFARADDPSDASPVATADRALRSESAQLPSFESRDASTIEAQSFQPWLLPGTPPDQAFGPDPMPVAPELAEANAARSDDVDPSLRRAGGAVRSLTDVAARISGRELGIPPKSYGHLLMMAMRFAREKLNGGAVINRPTGVPIVFTWPEGLKEMMVRGMPAEVLAAVPALPAMLAHARYLGPVCNAQHRPAVARVHLFSSAFDVGGRRVPTTLIVQESRWGWLFFDGILRSNANENYRLSRRSPVKPAFIHTPKSPQIPGGN